MELEESSFLTLGYTTKLQSSRQYSTGTHKKTKPEIYTYGTMGTSFLTKEARIYNGVLKTASSINGAWKTGELRVKE